ncbi:hypothetical protein Goari_005635 [Gossypium aridum]|uniref:Zinc knuckle CX2CX4HX4C domain-containing protein n=1 Tax=Gossypium aridum TaxID=34290 RepID=A0A7J8YNB9_GOSAI|nr:hypothetical protein [Gossypium aridum]
MHIRVKLNVNWPLKRRKKVMVGSDRIFYARFQYEKLSLFCFICGKLGHGESFCLIRTRLDPENIVFGWDLSIRAVARRRTVLPSRWLREVGGDDRNLLGSNGDLWPSNGLMVGQEPMDFMLNVENDLLHAKEEKKRQRRTSDITENELSAGSTGQSSWAS